MQQVISFLRETQAELAKVIWPTRNETIRLTIIVLVVSIAVGVFVGGLDFMFTNLMNILIKNYG